VRMTRALWLELKTVFGPETALPVVSLCAITLLHWLSPASGQESWRSLFIENCSSFIPLGVALAAVPLLLREAEHGTVEDAIALPARGILALRLALVIGGTAVLAVLWLAALAALWGPVPLGAGLYAALGPALWLTGLGLATSSIAGRATVGYLVTIGWVLADLIARLLGWFAQFPVLQWWNVLAYRWPLPSPGWPAVTAWQAVLGAVLLAGTVLTSPGLLRRLL